MTAPIVTVPAVAFFWGDDDLAAGRAVDRFAEAVSAASGEVTARRA